jgi:hypothetical protein
VRVQYDQDTGMGDKLGNASEKLKSKIRFRIALASWIYILYWGVSVEE